MPQVIHPTSAHSTAETTDEPVKKFSVGDHIYTIGGIYSFPHEPNVWWVSGRSMDADGTMKSFQVLAGENDVRFLEFSLEMP